MIKDQMCWKTTRTPAASLSPPLNTGAATVNTNHEQLIQMYEKTPNCDGWSARHIRTAQRPFAVQTEVSLKLRRYHQPGCGGAARGFAERSSQNLVGLRGVTELQRPPEDDSVHYSHNMKRYADDPVLNLTGQTELRGNNKNSRVGQNRDRLLNQHRSAGGCVCVCVYMCVLLLLFVCMCVLSEPRQLNTETSQAESSFIIHQHTQTLSQVWVCVCECVCECVFVCVCVCGLLFIWQILDNKPSHTVLFSTT